MKPVLLNSLLIVLIITFSVRAEELFSASSTERGISSFDFKVIEVKRKEGYSVLQIPRFQERTSTASRWMMCMYTELAILRNEKMWASIYSDDSGDKVTIVFPKANSLSDPVFSKVDLLGSQPQIMPIGIFKQFCGMK